jgi:Zn-dependent peptidase ImmA (M78 family)/transcriptional regulator with XRE-family HTH domain
MICKSEESMTIGERIKLGRQMAGLTLRELAATADISAQAISKYERNLDVPGSKVLIRMARAMHVSVEFFLRPKSISKIQPKFRRRQSLSAKGKNAILSRVSDWLERYLEIEDILSEDPFGLNFEPPAGFPRAVESLEDVEKAAGDLRSAWDLGSGPIDNFTDLMEARGLKVGSMDMDAKFDACTFQAENNLAVTAIVVRSDMPGDRQRFCLALELGHLMLLPDILDEEKAAHRFAAAFLVPEAAAHFELRGKRADLSLYELHLLKHKYGLSMQSWINRARDLDIISEAKARAFFKTFSSKGWRKQEPGDIIAPEVPRRFERLVMGALSDGLISESRAGELLGMPVRDFLTREAEVHGGWLAEVCN